MQLRCSEGLCHELDVIAFSAYPDVVVQQSRDDAGEGRYRGSQHESSDSGSCCAVCESLNELQQYARCDEHEEKDPAQEGEYASAIAVGELARARHGTTDLVILEQYRHGKCKVAFEDHQSGRYEEDKTEDQENPLGHHGDEQSTGVAERCAHGLLEVDLIAEVGSRCGASDGALGEGRYEDAGEADECRCEQPVRLLQQDRCLAKVGRDGPGYCCQDVDRNEDREVAPVDLECCIEYLGVGTRAEVGHQRCELALGSGSDASQAAMMGVRSGACGGRLLACGCGCDL